MRASKPTGEVVARPAHTLEIGPEWRWFRVADEEVNLSRRTATRRILQHLVSNWRSGGGTSASRDAFLDAGWPGERMAYDAGIARVHTTLWRVRRLGLDDLLVSDDAGYRLREDMTVVQR